MLWLFFALLASINGAYFSTVNRTYKMEGFRLNFFRMVFAALLLLPVVAFFTWPTTPLFYATAIVHGAVMVIGNAVTLTMASKHNGRVATMFIPVQIFVGFFLWLAISPTMWKFYLLQPTNLIYILFPFTLMCFALYSMRKMDANFKTFLQIAPIGVMFATIDLFAKLITGDITLMQTFIYAAVAFVAGSVLSAPFLFIKQIRIHPTKPICPPNMLKVAWLLGVSSVFGFCVFLISLRLSPNPAYVTAISTLTPLWIMLYHRFAKIEDKGDIRSAIIMIISALLLVILTVGHV